MGKGRLEAFSDGVIAIIITIMVLELKTPESGELRALRPLLPDLLSYALSFVFVGIYWNNHHHLLHAAGPVSAATMWANLHLLFWLSLIPFGTRWLAGSDAGQAATAAYGLVLLLSAIAYELLQKVILHGHPEDPDVVRRIGRDVKGYVSIASYVAGIALAFVETRASIALYTFVALIWLVPDRRLAPKRT